MLLMYGSKFITVKVQMAKQSKDPKPSENKYSFKFIAILILTKGWTFGKLKNGFYFNNLGRRVFFFYFSQNIGFIELDFTAYRRALTPYV